MAKGKPVTPFGKGFAPGAPGMKKPPGKGGKKAASKKAPPFGKGMMPGC